MEHRDAVVVGARCAGAALANMLARQGASVVMVDRDPPGTDTLSTHYVFPNGLCRLEELGVLERLDARHELSFSRHEIAYGEHRVTGEWTAVGGHELGLCVRRLVLDRELANAALDAGAEGRFGERVAGLLGSGTPDDPVGGVVLESGEGVRADLVVGADGRASVVAGRLGLEKRDALESDVSLLLGYWRGVPWRGSNLIHVRQDLILNAIPCEDGVLLLNVTGGVEFTRGSPAEKRRRYLEALASFPEELDTADLDRGELIGDRVLAAPSSMLRGYFRKAAGPGWALVGDSGHFKHPATAQGISDAFEQAAYVADRLAAGENLDDYEAWRDERAAEHYPFSFRFSRRPSPRGGQAFFGALASDPRLAQDFRDIFSRRIEPSLAFDPARRAAASPAEDAAASSDSGA